MKPWVRVESREHKGMWRRQSSDGKIRAIVTADLDTLNCGRLIYEVKVSYYGTVMMQQFHDVVVAGTLAGAFAWADMQLKILGGSR